MTSSITAPASAVPAHAFEFAERVRWEDVDLVAIVRYSAYTRLVDVVEAELFRAAGLAHPTIVDRFGIWLVRRVLHLEYHAPAHFDDLLRLRAWIGRVGRTSLTLHVAVFDDAGERLHAAGHLVLVAVEAAGMSAVEVPAEVTGALAPFRT